MLVCESRYSCNLVALGGVKSDTGILSGDETELLTELAALLLGDDDTGIEPGVSLLVVVELLFAPGLLAVFSEVSSAGAPPQADNNVGTITKSTRHISFFMHLYIYKHLGLKCVDFGFTNTISRSNIL